MEQDYVQYPMPWHLKSLSKEDPRVGRFRAAALLTEGRGVVRGAGEDALPAVHVVRGAQDENALPIHGARPGRHMRVCALRFPL